MKVGPCKKRHKKKLFYAFHIKHGEPIFAVRKTRKEASSACFELISRSDREYSIGGGK
jgi:hypothetical protein